jgi:hypothetical protein
MKRLEMDLQYPFGLTFPREAIIEHGYCFGGRDRGDIFRLKVSPEAGQKILNDLCSFSKSAQGYTVAFDQTVEEAPFGIGSKDFLPPSLKSLEWWAPWALSDAVVIDVKARASGPGLWICISPKEGVIYVCGWDT